MATPGRGKAFESDLSDYTFHWVLEAPGLLSNGVDWLQTAVAPARPSPFSGRPDAPRGAL